MEKKIKQILLLLYMVLKLYIAFYWSFSTAIKFSFDIIYNKVLVNDFSYHLLSTDEHKKSTFSLPLHQKYV